MSLPSLLAMIKEYDAYDQKAFSHRLQLHKRYSEHLKTLTNHFGQFLRVFDDLRRKNTRYGRHALMLQDSVSSIDMFLVYLRLCRVSSCSYLSSSWLSPFHMLRHVSFKAASISLQQVFSDRGHHTIPSLADEQRITSMFKPVPYQQDIISVSKILASIPKHDEYWVVWLVYTLLIPQIRYFHHKDCFAVLLDYFFSEIENLSQIPAPIAEANKPLPTLSTLCRTAFIVNKNDIVTAKQLPIHILYHLTGQKEQCFFTPTQQQQENGQLSTATQLIDTVSNGLLDLSDDMLTFDDTVCLASQVSKECYEWDDFFSQIACFLDVHDQRSWTLVTRTTSERYRMLFPLPPIMYLGLLTRSLWYHISLSLHRSTSLLLNALLSAEQTSLCIAQNNSSNDMTHMDDDYSSNTLSHIDTTMYVSPPVSCRMMSSTTTLSSMWPNNPTSPISLLPLGNISSYSSSMNTPRLSVAGPHPMSFTSSMENANEIHVGRNAATTNVINHSYVPFATCKPHHYGSIIREFDQLEISSKSPLFWWYVLTLGDMHVSICYDARYRRDPEGKTMPLNRWMIFVFRTTDNTDNVFKEWTKRQYKAEWEEMVAMAEKNQAWIFSSFFSMYVFWNELMSLWLSTPSISQIFRKEEMRIFQMSDSGCRL